MEFRETLKTNMISNRLFRSRGERQHSRKIMQTATRDQLCAEKVDTKKKRKKAPRRSLRAGVGLGGVIKTAARNRGKKKWPKTLVAELTQQRGRALHLRLKTSTRPNRS